MSITAFNLRCLRSVPPRIGLKQILMESPTRQVGCRFAAHIPEAVVVRGFKTRRHEQIDSVVVNIFGRNRVGLVKDFADVIFINGGNIEESRMDRVGDYFSMLTMVTLPRSDKAAEALQSDLDVKFNEDTLIEPKDNLKISAQPSGRWDRPESLDLAMVTVTGNEQKGIVREVTGVFKDHGVDVITAGTEVLNAPYTGNRIFRMEVVVVVPDGDKPALGDRLHVIEEAFDRLDIEIDAGW